MASDNSTELMVVDLLFDELTGEEAEEARRQVESSAEAKAELEQFERLVDDIEAPLRSAAPSESVHDSILAAAREQAVQYSADAARADRRPGAPREDTSDEEPATTSRSLWKKVHIGAVAQIATVAGILIVGTVVFSTFSTTVEHKFEAANESVPSSVSFGGGSEPVASSTQEGASSAPASATAPSLDGQTLALADETDRAAAEAEQAKPARPAAGEGDASGAGKSVDSLDGAQLAIRDNFAEAEEKRSYRTRSPRRRARSRSSASKSKKKSSRKKSDDAVALFEGGRGGSESGSAAGLGSIESSPGAGSGADVELDALADKTAEKPKKEESPSLGSVQRSYESNDYRATVRRADAFVEMEAGSTSDRARALELKAMALEKLGRLDAADSVYAAIQDDYPSYRNQTITRRRSSLRSKIDASNRATASKARKAREAKSKPQPTSGTSDEATSEAAPAEAADIDALE